MASMKAARIHEFGGPKVIQIEQIPIPQPGKGEVLIRIAAASVNPVDYKIREGKFPPVTAKQLPVTLGRDFSGMVEQVGSGVEGFTKGRRVFGMVGGDASYAEYAVIKAAYLAPIPVSFDFLSAAAVPLAAQTAWQALFTNGQLKAGQSVLIQGASGGVGHFAVQLAKARGATVYATGSEKSKDFIKSLGADYVIEYGKQHFEDVCSDLDLVVNLVSGDMQQRAWSVLREGGILVSTLSKPDAGRPDAQGKRGVFFLVEPSGSQLQEIADMMASGKLQITLDMTFELDKAAQAQRYLEEAHVQGKVVLSIVG